MCAEKVKYFGELELQGDNRMENVWFQSPALLLTQLVSGMKKVNSLLGCTINEFQLIYANLFLC